MLEVINRLRAMKQWSDRIGSDEIAEIDEMISILMKQLASDKKTAIEISKILTE
jgi:hypothetical protein